MDEELQVECANVAGTTRKILYEPTVTYQTEIYDTFDDLFDHLQIGDNVLVQTDYHSPICLMTVQQLTSTGLILFVDDVGIETHGELTPCYKVWKVIDTVK